MRLAPIFHDHAVLQRDLSLPIWGLTGPGEAVIVELAGRQARVTAGPDGSWLLRLPALPAGGPHELVARSASGEVRVRDILIGEVWVCSGQSNMEWKLQQTPQQLDPAACHHPAIRLLTVATPARQGRQSEIDGRWTLADHASLAAFSAIGGWFGRILHRELGVPVGLICNAWGGTRVQAWMSREALMVEEFGRGEVLGYEGFAYGMPKSGGVKSQADWEQEMQALDTGNAGLAQGWAGPGFDDAAWEAMPVPSRWQDFGHATSGVWWYRRTVSVPAAWRGQDLELHLGAVDKHDDTYVNGERVGGLSWNAGLNSWCAPRVYPIPARLIGADGRLTVAVRARSHIYHGGLIGPSTAMQLHPVGTTAGAVPLAGDWRARREQDWGLNTQPAGQMAASNPNAPYTLFDSRLAPLIPYAIRGAIWYQGESNAGEPKVYKRLLPAMIHDWRRAWGQGDFAFLQVQLANYMPAADGPRPSDWAELRDAQTATLAVPETGMAVAIDVGDANDIHPTDKRTVGERLARWALSRTYARGGVPCGPLFQCLTVEADSRLRCRFAHAAGLRTKDGKPPYRVAIAGWDRLFMWAEARIEGDTLVVWHKDIAQPVAVRYAWADNPEGCNLVNAEGLPASPFRSDAW
ncbi:MAG TPA: 9-O-acetylesterase [Planctomycetes bacterium]|nr:9-O-acetylesterase [Planctomycetota bacterium]